MTSKVSELTQQLITTRFCKQFTDELAELGLETLSVDLLDVGGSKGKTEFGVRINGAAIPTIRLREIASEGEQRCIALALFLAELSTASHRSALVFDDPVSSLGHEHRGKIAARLGKESKTRQVIVFTHDTVFISDLQLVAADHARPAEFRSITWGLNGAGVQQPGSVSAGLPWELKSVNDRIDMLEKTQSSLSKTWGVPKPTEQQIADIGKAYSQLRATVARTIEREIFGEVVFCYRDYIAVKNLEKVVGFSMTECDAIKKLFKRCCDITEAHDPASGKAKPPP
ncbi:AAA family ATPase [Paraburkholderia aspalathi]|uniref:AAA family ATPase n=1 Tax=Paraburkholderia aspalathi TaxID=1324617 RepID=UPI0038BCE083